jgi:hypothetical protein
MHGTTRASVSIEGQHLVIAHAVVSVSATSLELLFRSNLNKVPKSSPAGKAVTSSVARKPVRLGRAKIIGPHDIETF